MDVLCHIKKKPPLPFLPLRHTFTSGAKVVIRYATEDEVPLVYRMFREAAKEGEGYSTDEFTTLEHFRYYVADNGHLFVIRNVETFEIMVVVAITPSHFCRSMDPLYCDHYIVVGRDHRGKHLGLETSRLLHSMSKSLGYSGVIADMLSTSMAAVRVLTTQGHTLSAIIPKAGKGKEGEMLNVVVTSFYLTNVPYLRSRI